MFDSPYEFQYKNHNKGGPQDPFLRLHTYKFMVDGEPYIVRAEEYKWRVFAIKFYPKSFEDSPDRYRKLTKKGKASRILSTCLQVMLDIRRRYPQASLCFVGSNFEGEKSMVRTKRFKVYSRIIEEFFSPLSYAHAQYPAYSAYLLLSLAHKKKEPNLLPKIERFLFETFDFGEKPPDVPVET